MTLRTLPRVVAAIAFILVSYALILHSALSPLVAASFAAFIVASAVRPAACLTATAALAPFIAAYAWHWGRSLRWSEAIVIAFLTGALIRLVVRPGHPPPDRRTFEYASLAFIAVVAASWVVELVMLQYTTDYPAHFARIVWELFTREFFHDPGAFVRLNDALVLIEGAALAVCVRRFSATQSPLPDAVLRMTVVAACASALLNVQRAAQLVVQQGGGWHTVGAMLASMRFSVLHADVNAAGSYFAMALPIALGLGTAARRQAAWLLTVPIIGAAIWLAGSRAAMAGAAVGTVWFLVAAVTIARTRLERGARSALLIAAAAFVAYAAMQYPRSRNISASIALNVRTDMANVALDLFATRPVFGIGAGTFWQRSGDYIPPNLKPFYAHENAHNNFLQILAELGVLGLALFLAAVAAAALPLQSIRGPDGTVLAGVLAGLIAFLLTCLVGHPLLTREVAYPFWLVIGAFASLRRRGVMQQQPVLTNPAWGIRNARTWTAAFAVAVAISIPFRVQYEKRSRDFENAAIGFSLWNTTEDGVRFRWAQPRSRLFVPRNASSVVIPLRLNPRVSKPARVAVHLDGRLANTVAVTRDRWTTVRVVLASGRRAPRYRLIELDVEIPDAAAERRAGGTAETALMVGRTNAS